jgi:DNA processing protein
MLDVETLALDWLIAQSHTDLPPAAFRRLIQTVSHPANLLNLPAKTASELLLCAQRLRRLERALSSVSIRDQLSAELRRAGAGLICCHCPSYPLLLKEIHDPPPLLYYRGELGLLSQPLLAVVGSRRPSRGGVRDATDFAKALSNSGLTVVSGMAMGIDSAAHLGALAGKSASIAVLGTGIDICYPRRNQGLYEELGQSGLLLSEFAPGTGPRRHQFPLRNRVISGMSLGVLVVEAAINSGSLITARQALEQNREVFALPGSIHNPASRGCNSLIRQGAKLVDSLGDIIEELSGWSGNSCETAEAQEPLPPEAVVLDLGFEPTPLDVLAQRAELSTAEMLSMLSDLELSGWVEQTAGGWQRCR